MKFKYLCFTLTTTFILTMAIAPGLKAESGTPNNAEKVESATAAKSFISIDRGHYTTGRIKIIRDEGKTYLEFDQAFSTVKGPELKVILYRETSVPFSLPQKADYVTVAPLQSFNGKQRYFISDRLDLSQYASVAIWCEKFNITFAYAPLPEVRKVIAVGNFVNVASDRSQPATTGIASIIEEHGQQYLQFDDTFATHRDRQLKVVLNRNSAKSSKIKSKEYVSLASLKKSRGKQRYLLPKGISVKDYNSVVIWCKDSSLPLGYASLE